MIINWFKKNILDYPQFYQNYIETFQNNTEKGYVVFDFEIIRDEIVKIFALKIKDNKIIMKNIFEINIKNDNIENSINEVVVEEGIIQFLNYIKKYPLISFQINEKIDLVNIILEKLKAGKIENELFSIDLLYSSLDKEIRIENISLKNIAQKLKLDYFYSDFLNDRVFFKALIFLKLNTKLNVEKFLK